ncbi:MAG: hypothetical protein JOY71_29520 [Acetobacteraceae bacterium]|nr:hypothetical protein [Acetobacteraceae bacterium]MBV8526202.1 hypothetical protein [Acetobacteraceae bacterium]MBV8590215.1 hypothetical protein [Acetobacteraceae bacterium]
MDQPISGHVVRLLPAHGYVILLLDDAQEIAVSRDRLSEGMFGRLHVGDRVWYFPDPGEGPHTKHQGRVVPIPSQ